MSFSADNADLRAPGDPAAYRRRRGLKAGAVTVFGLLCIAGGVAIGLNGPKLLAKRPAAWLPETAPATAPTPPPVPLVVQAPPIPPVEPPASSADLARLDARLSALEGQEARIARAAAATLSAAAVVEASQGSRPFTEELAALRAAQPTAPELAALARLAEGGAPSRSSLADSFRDYAARAAAAAHRPAQDAGLLDRFRYALMQIVTLRRVGETAGKGPDADLALAERRVADGDVDGALKAIDRLPPAAREAVAPWRTGAERRAEIDRLVASLRARALAELSR